MIDAGYFAKQIEPNSESLKLPGVREICSVSECISSSPEGWVDHWLHNGFGWFNCAVDAVRVIPSGHESEYRLFGYRVHPEIFRNGNRVPLTIPADVRPEPIPSTFRSLGFDSLNKSMDSVLGLECSPLSCNAMAAEIEVNEFCLFPELNSAIAAAERFSREQPEPGDYYVVEVLERTNDVI